MKTYGRRQSRLLGGIIIVAGLLSACQPQPVKPPVDKARQQMLEDQRRIQQQQTQKRQIQSMLQRAEFQLGRDRLMTPARDSAYGYYQAVLRLEPDNQQAKSGLQSIVIRYIQLARDALAHSKLGLAEQYYDHAKRMAPRNPLLAEFEAALQQAQEKKTDLAEQSEFVLDRQALAQRQTQIVELLQQVATRVKTSDESVLIVARNDAEGRWLYQQMRKAAEGYRIRGDIKVGPEPKIVLHPPIY